MALADSEAHWSFTMDHRYVSGADNGVIHAMDEGFVSNVGELWVTSQEPGVVVAPLSVHIEVYRQRPLRDDLICSTVVKPEPQQGDRVRFTEACGAQSAGNYYVVAWKVEDDGWNLAGSGHLFSQSCLTYVVDTLITRYEVEQCA